MDLAGVVNSLQREFPEGFACSEPVRLAPGKVGYYAAAVWARNGFGLSMRAHQSSELADVLVYRCTTHGEIQAWGLEGLPGEHGRDLTFDGIREAFGKLLPLVNDFADTQTHDHARN